MIAYEEQLGADRLWALQEGSMHFSGDNAVHRTLAKNTARLDAPHVPYAIAGGMALFFHGYRRFTEDVDLVVTSQGLETVHDQLIGLGFVPPFANSKNLRDVENGVHIKFLVTGQFPGDGRPKPVAFPDPAAEFEVIEGMRFVSLPRLVDMKLASGMTNAARLRDLADVQELIKHLSLDESFTVRLNPYVRDKFL